ncbi:MAG: caspase family protein [Acidobacteriota bacterium]
MKILNLIVIAAVLVVASVSAQTNRELQRDKNLAASEKRTALVIGNGAYADAPLKNPPNDANDIAAALKTLGFEVMSYTNLDQTGMKRAIREFGTKLRAKGGVGLFYYAGHGVQVKGTNYLIPVGANVNTEEEVEYESVEAGLAIAQMESAKNQMNIVILDACRNNPFARSFRSADKGLASIDAPAGTLLAYSTAPGSVASDGVGRNGLYTQELLKAIRMTGLSIEDVFKRVRITVRSATTDKQTPWESSSLTGKFFFSGGERSNASANVVSTDTVTYEKEFWESMKNSTDARDFEEYLTNYPGGVYAPTARLKLRKLSEPKTDSQPDEADREVSTGSYADWLVKADEAINKEDTATAIELLKKAIAADNSKAGAYEKLGNIYFDQLDEANAVPTMTAALKNGATLAFKGVMKDPTGMGGSVESGQLKFTKSTLTFEGKKTYEADLAEMDITINKERYLTVSMKPGIDKIVKGSKNDTRMHFYYYWYGKGSARRAETRVRILTAILNGLRP